MPYLLTILVRFRHHSDGVQKPERRALSVLITVKNDDLLHREFLV
jgi:hypothetical protein